VAGRIDDAAHEVAVAKASDIGPYASEIQEHLRHVLASHAFHGSRRCQEFLSYVVEHALSGDFGGLKERVLGIRIFSRDPGYNTSDDSIVRVTASDVRKRLLQYYKTSGPSKFRIELQSGSYIPEFHHVVGEIAGQPAGGQRPADLPAVDHGLLLTTDDSSNKPAIGELRRPRALKLPWLFGLVAISLCLVFFVIGWTASRLEGNVTHRPGARARNEYSFYRELLGPLATDSQRATYIVLSNPILYLYRGSHSPPADSNPDGWEKRIPITQTLARQLESGATDPQPEFSHPYLALDTTDYTGLGEAKTALHLERLFDALDRSPNLTEARFLNWEQAQNQHLIFLGAPHMSTWIQNNLATIAFTMDQNVIRNLHPLPGEQSVYQRKFDGKVLEDYGLIWMSRSPSGSQMLVLAGLTSTGTAGVGAFFADPNEMRPVFEKLRLASPNGSTPPNWQVLLQITARDKVPLHVSFVTLRISSNKTE
jgi:hypothetical protein